MPEKIKSQAILALKDEYTFDLVGLSEEHSEYELEQAIIKNIRAFLMEFGPDFAFVGNQYRIEVDGKEYFIDLLLYNRRLQAMIAIELKIGEFLPEYKGKMEFYLNVLNDTVRLPHENPAIGIIICKSKSRMIVEYALKSSTMPIGVATYSLSPELPEAYKELLPTSEEIAKKIELLMEYGITYKCRCLHIGTFYILFIRDFARPLQHTVPVKLDSSGLEAHFAEGYMLDIVPVLVS